mgnify:CR=1 FL=1
MMSKKNLVYIYMSFLSLFLYQNLSADVKFQPVEKLNSGNYQFKVSKKINLSLNFQKGVSIVNLTRDYLNYFKTSSIYDTNEINISMEDGGKESVISFSMKEQRQTSHGSMVLEGKSHLRSSKEQLTYTFKTISIKASGNASYTKSEEQIVSLRKEDSDSYSLTVSKVVEVDKPFFAPKAIFESEVKKGLREDIENYAKQYLEILETSF